MTYPQLYKLHGTINIKCQGADMLPLVALQDFQGKLKKRSKENKLRLATQIFTKGFTAPFFVWKNKDEYFLLDGHGRADVLHEIHEEGIPIPDLFPVVYIEADNKADAREKLLGITSQYGEFDEAELSGWLDAIDSDLAESFRLVDTELERLAKAAETEGDDEIPENVEAITKPGDLWEFGSKVWCNHCKKWHYLA